MSDTLGSLIDKLFTVDTKMYDNQELLYEIRRMDFKTFCGKFAGDAGMEDLWQRLTKVCDLNVQRNQLIDEIDEKVVEIARHAGMTHGIGNFDKFVQRKHKTY